MNRRTSRTLVASLVGGDRGSKRGRRSAGHSSAHASRNAYMRTSTSPPKTGSAVSPADDTASRLQCCREVAETSSRQCTVARSRRPHRAELVYAYIQRRQIDIRIRAYNEDMLCGVNEWVEGCNASDDGAVARGGG
eukprot:GHVU01173850.1.p2 GENE.GHVU01173850.1~~GHVU01173850.1.p2  ORF type:complete len:136 (+),score=2.92 GHVU01173850.1:218-625(+)